jgi:hypothetical protein
MTPSPELPKPSRWSKTGFFIGIALWIASLFFTFIFGPWVLPLGLLLMIFLGISNRKYGYVSGFLAGFLICAGLFLLVVSIFCGPGFRILMGCAWCLGVLLFTQQTGQLLFSGAVIFAGMVAAHIHFKWPLFIAGVWIGLGLTPVIAVIQCFASLSNI